MFPRSPPHRSDGGYKSDKEGRDAQPTLVWGPLTEKGRVEAGGGATGN